MDVNRLIEEACNAVYRDRGGARFGLDVAEETLHHTANLGEVTLHPLGVHHHIHQDIFALQVHRQIQHATPVDVARDIAVAGLQLLDEGLQSLEGGRTEGGLLVDLQLLAVGADDLRCRVGKVFDAAAEHLRQQVTCSQMYGTDFGACLVAVESQTAIAKAVVEGLLHQLLVAHTATGIVKEIFIEADADVLVPPRGVKDHIYGQGLRGQFFHLQFWF